MPKEKKTKYIILGFLLNSSLSGYEIGKLIKKSTSYFWQESDASIYPTLKILEKEGLVTSKIEYVGRRKKALFSISEEGRAVFTSWINRNPDQDLYRRELLLKFFFTSKSTKDEILRHLNQRLQELYKLHAEYVDIQMELNQNVSQNRYWLKSVQLGIQHVATDIQWIKEQLLEV